MRVVLFGASGMVGQGVLRECVLDPGVTAVVSVVRRASAPALGRRSEKVREVVAHDLSDLSRVEGHLMGCDACFFCAGVSAIGMKEQDYRRVTYDLTLSAARTLFRLNPTTASSGMTFIYVSGAGTNSNGRAMWARVKGETEDWLLSMGFKAAYMFRPAMIVPRDGIVSKTKAYRLLYAALRRVLPLLLWRFPHYVTTTDQLGRAMIAVARHGYAKPVLEAEDIARV
ncbi:MAG TPA: NAD-dependent epimerase/dehydratase family protein [Acidobacteriaceae bacterium]|nr:NAD-dependent epimerase/dehydratase family protein [Acidobacteriaceae bacterium]